MASWNVISNSQDLTGVVRSHERNGGVVGDGDWILKIAPDQADHLLLINRAGVVNRNRLVECEVEPNDSIDNDAMEAHFFAPLVGLRVTVSGPWVEDTRHDNKTEIHPILSILVDRGITGPVKRIEFFVIADDSWSSSVPQPVDEGRFRVAYPPPPVAAAVVPRFAETEVEIRPGHGLKLIQPVQQGNSFFLEGRIGAGAPPLAGFYHSVILMWFDSTDIELRRFRSSPAKRFVQTNRVWSIRYDVRAEAVLSNQSRPDLAIESVSWRLQRSGQSDLTANGNPLTFANVELVRGPNGKFDYHPQLAADVAINIPGSAPLVVRRVLDLRQPKVLIELLALPTQGVLSPHSGGRKKITWHARCRAKAAGFIKSRSLTYDWTIDPIPADPANAVSISGRDLSEVDFDLEYALPNKNTYIYKVSVTVTDEHGLEQAIAGLEINLPRPSAHIVLVGPLQVLRQPSSGVNGLYRFEGSAAVASMYGTLAYDWRVSNTNGWAVTNQSRSDKEIFSFEFEYYFPLGLQGFPLAGPVVEVTVTDEAGQTANDSLDVSVSVPGVQSAFNRAFRQSLRWLNDMREPTFMGLIPIPPISDGTLETIITQLKQRQESLLLGTVARVPPSAEDSKGFVKSVQQVMEQTTSEWKGRNDKDGLKTAIREFVGRAFIKSEGWMNNDRFDDESLDQGEIDKS